MSVRTRVRGGKRGRGVILGACALALVLASAASGLAEASLSQEAALTQEVRVIGSRVNVREAPTTESAVAFQVTRGQTLRVVEKRGNWYLIESHSRRGYVYGPLVEIVEVSPDRQPPARTSPVMTSPPSSEEGLDPVTEAQERDWAQKKRRHGLYKLVGGAAGVVTGLAVMGKSKAAGFGLLGAGGYFLWDGYSDRQEAGRRLHWGVAVHVDRDMKGVAYHMSW